MLLSVEIMVDHRFIITVDCPRRVIQRGQQIALDITHLGGILAEVIQKIVVNHNGNCDIYLRLFGDIGLDETFLIADNHT